MEQEELELKLTFEADELARFRRSAVLRRLADSPAKRKRLFAHYFDTPGLDLKTKKISMRVRRENGEWIQTVKVKGNKSGGLQARLEYNAARNEPTVDILAIGNAKMRDKVSDIIGNETLKPVFTTDVWRTTRQLRYGDSVIELAIDTGWIRSGKAREAVCEAELELIEGRGRDILGLALELRNLFDFRIGTGSKAVRGYRLYQPGLLAPVYANRLDLKKGMSAWDAASLAIAEGQSQLMENEDIVLADAHIEGLHQARIGLRRMVSALTLLKKHTPKKGRKKIVKDVKWLQTITGPARDWDVFLSETLAPLRELHGGHPALDALAECAVSCRGEAYAKVYSALRSRRYADLLLRLEAWLMQGGKGKALNVELKDVFQAPLSDLRADVMHVVPGDIRLLSEEQLHSLRLDIKKLRYAGEFFESLGGEKKTKAFLKSCRRLQDCLGILNDIVVTEDLIGKLGKPDDPVITEAVALIADVHATRKVEKLRNLEKCWKKFVGAKPYWA